MLQFVLLALAFCLYFAWDKWTKARGPAGEGCRPEASYKSNAPYKRSYRSRVDDAAGGAEPGRAPLPSPRAATGAAQGVPECKFFLSAKQHLKRDYILVVDRSGSMSSGTRWRDATAAVATLAPYICRFDPDGVTLIFFDSEVVVFDNIQTPAEVERLFKKFPPRGSTNLSAALHAAFEQHFGGSRGATTVLVVTDGAPDSCPEVERILRRAANSIGVDEELSVSFVQIGSDRGAQTFLQRLDDDLEGARFDIVDTITAAAAQDMSFPELVARSIYD